MNYKTNNEKLQKVLGIDAEGNDKFDLNIKEITVKEAADADLYLPCDMSYFKAITFLRARVLYNKTLINLSYKESLDMEFVRAHTDEFPVDELVKELKEESKKLKEKEEADQKKQSEKEESDEVKEKKTVADDKASYDEGLKYDVTIPSDCDDHKKRMMIRLINTGFDQVKDDIIDKKFIVSEIFGATNFVMTEVGGEQIAWIHRDPEVSDSMMIELAKNTDEHNKNVKAFKKLVAKKDKESKTV